MKTLFLARFPGNCRALVAGVLTLVSIPAFATTTTFTNNTSIGAANSNYDGTDIVITNCTVTMDGPHSFSSLHVAAGGMLTHSFAPGGTVSNLYYVTNEAQILYSTIPVTLVYSNVITASVVISDLTDTNFYTNGQDYLLTSPDGIATQLQRTTNSTIPDGGTVLVSYEGNGTPPGTVPGGLNLSIAGNVAVDVNGAINANGAGYLNGPGAGFYSGSGSGGGYGGNGGASSSTAIGGSPYGSFLQATNLGSGGGGGITGGNGAGGGLIQIVAGGTVAINGLVSANGANGTNDFAGGGSGGGINISALSLSGSGTVTANGGSGEATYGGGGGGGRISFQYSSSSFTGSMTAYGGTGSMLGTAGTIYTQVSGQNGLLIFDNGGRLSATNTTFSLLNSSVNVLIRNAASIQPPGSSGSWNFASLTIASNGYLFAPLASTLTLSAISAVTVEPGGSIIANGKGYGPGAGTGAGHSFNDNLYWPCGGGSYGGPGGYGSSTNATGGATYGSQSAPSGFGSGGGSANISVGGSGGGAISIATKGIVQVDGIISANGLNGSGTGGGGGSGGTITINGGTLLGSGIISANGGSGANSYGGGGGGGRIWINPSASIFAGTISAYGGGGANQGGAGTVLMQIVGQNMQLILDNGGNSGTNTPVQSASSADLIVRGGATGCANPSVNFANLYIYSNSWLTPLYTQGSPAASITFSFSGNATIQAGGGITANLAGYAPGQGSGAGRTDTVGSTNFCSGAGHGGIGGNSLGSYAIGGSTYDSPTGPAVAGSGGGSSSPLSPGGAGGGIVRLSVTGTLELDGVISANGGNGSGLAGGGGSGGSIWLSAGTFSGAGSVAANGGAGANASGGGGGGGMIYISSANNVFTGSAAAYGGGGANWGGAGTVLTQGSSGNSQLVLDGGGNPGALSPLPNSSTINITLRNGAVGYVNGSLTTGNLLVSSNASVLVSNAYTGYSVNCSSLTVQAEGSIIADSEGSAAGQGIAAGRSYGQSPYYPCGGGGNSGSGGNSISNLALGGINSQSYQLLAGSGGGTDSPYSLGGSGGGIISITTAGAMQIDGLISANGANGGGIGGGGGAGGSISLSAGSLGGQGVIRANGGTGANSIGGGGGGGAISVTVSSTASQFNGTMTAYGGGGANWGGAGMIATQINGQTVQMVLDNGGNSGATTPLIISSSPSLTVRNAAVGQVGSSLSLNSLVVASNASLLVSNYPGSSTTMSFQSADIEAGGSIVADFLGYAEGLGNGSGRALSVSPNFPCSGAGHGGIGGSAITNAAVGGSAYDSQTSPVNPGSGGGYYLPYSTGGSGGGAFSITVSSLLQVDGTISANGGNGSGIGGGGGSGGSIKITAGTLSGGGSIRANGGSGAGSIGGGGAGGCIALYPNTANLFSGTISASGGGGANWGGAGTIYLQNTGATSQLILDNGGQTGAPTPISTASSSIALILRNGAVAYQQSVPQTFASLLITSSGLLTANSNSGVVNLTLTGGATIEAGGGIVTDGLGSGPNSGSGAGSSSGSNEPYYPSSGGGYGGIGGNSSNSIPGGGSYSSLTSPASVGSGGGGFSYSLGGSGGGSIRLGVAGTLDVSGRISANGGNGGGLGGGGGSGGSILLALSTVEGTGAITANGGSGAGNVGGGGGGGRIAITYNSSGFTGPITAHGGGGYAYGGAGTIYTKANSQSIGQVLVENGGAAGTNTPLSVALGAPSAAFNLTIESNAVVSPQTNTTFPLLNSLTISSGGVLTGPSGLTTLDLLVLGNVDVAPGSSIEVNREGYSQANGPGAGQTGDETGSGAGYGGVGGVSLDASGGVSYGSAFQPVDFGSGGGIGYGTQSGGSFGGGALRLNVGGVLTVDGEISAEGGPGIQESWGGGSGGSIWVDTGALAGGGFIAADGGGGQSDSGGGGAGGRIALYIRTNAFFGGTSASGGSGYSVGSAGTVFASNNVPTLQVLSNSLSGTFTNAVSSLVLYFNGAPNPNSINAGTVFLTAPNGAVSPLSSSTMQTSSTYLVSFPPQTAVGTNTLTVSNVVDLYGRALSPVYTATFTISLPVIQGTVTDGYGNPLGGVVLQPSTGSSASTDTNGNYSLGFVPGSSLTITPSSGSLIFLPPSMSYTNLSATVSGQNYVGVATIAPMLSGAVNASNFSLNWQALPGVNYQVYYSTDLVNWLPYGGALTGSNGPVQLLIPTSGNPQQFFSVQPSY